MNGAKDRPTKRDQQQAVDSRDPWPFEHDGDRYEPAVESEEEWL